MARANHPTAIVRSIQYRSAQQPNAKSRNHLLVAVSPRQTQFFPACWLRLLVGWKNIGFWTFASACRIFPSHIRRRLGHCAYRPHLLPTSELPGGHRESLVTLYVFTRTVITGLDLAYACTGLLALAPSAVASTDLPSS